MKTLFLGALAARVAPRILAKMAEKDKIEPTIQADLNDQQKMIPALAEAEIVVCHIWREDFPQAPRLKLMQTATAGIDWIEIPALPSGVTVCNVFGHEPAIAEYIMGTMLALTLRLFQTVEDFRGGSWGGHQPAGGSPHGEIFGRTIGIVGYGRIGRDVAKRAASFGCKVIAANRSPIADKGDAAEIYPLAELDQMLPHCDVVVVAAGLAPETRNLLDARRIGLMKPTALVINIGRAPIINEDALFDALSNNRLGGAALDVWWQHFQPDQPNRRPSRHPFQELRNVLMTPHCSGFTDGTSDRRWGDLAANLDRFVRGETLHNIVLHT
ncbi:MAG: phosphoglycerate dehydrogenase [Alphaproteobacteria bacterium]|nr:phosphoglycerate dehydrogenase [Alphaproteobacteria bacterium]